MYSLKDSVNKLPIELHEYIIQFLNIEEIFSLKDYFNEKIIFNKINLNWYQILLIGNVKIVDYLISKKYNTDKLVIDINWDIILLNFNCDIIEYLFLKIFKLHELLHIMYTMSIYDTCIYFDKIVIDCNLDKLKLLDKIFQNYIINISVIEKCNNIEIINFINIHLPKKFIVYRTKYNYCLNQINNITRMSIENFTFCNCLNCGDGIGWSV